MSVSAEEIVILLRGEASLELQSRFLAENAQSDSVMAGMLKATEAWAHTRLNPNCPSPPSSPPNEKPVVTVLRKAAFWDDKDDEGVAPTVGVKDLLDYIRGIASPETAAKLKEALANPSSNLSLLFKQMERETEKNRPQPSKPRRPQKG
jgi:hypothetical protein